MPLYSIQGPDGKTYSIEGPPGATREQVIRAIQARMQESAQTITAPPAPQPEESGILRQALDIPLQVVRGGVGGIRMLADVFGAGSSASEALKSADTWLADLLSSQAKNDQRRIAEILKEAEDKGVLAQVGAGLRALATAPVDTLAQALGSTAPVIIAGLASGPVGAALGVARAGAVAMPAVGAAMGVGEVKGSIYDAVEQAYKEKGASDEIARAKALEAQSYASSNLPSMVAAGGLGAIAGGMGIERPLASMLSRGAVKDVAEQQALRDAERGLLPRVGLGALREGAPEFAQAGQSQLAQNIALRSEGFDVPLFRNVFGAGAMEGAAGAILGGGLAVPRTGVERLPGQQEGESDAAFARRMSQEIEAARQREQIPTTPPVTAPVTAPEAIAPTEPIAPPTAPAAPPAQEVAEDMFRFPDGAIGTLDQARAYVMSLPPAQRIPTLQGIMGQRVQKEKVVPPDLFTQKPTEVTAAEAAVGEPTKPLELAPVETEKPATEISEQAKPTEVKPAQAVTKEEEEAATDVQAAEQKPEQYGVSGYPIVELPLDQLTLSTDVPQFKSDADAKGVVEPLGGQFDRRGVAPIQVWKRTDGRMEVISGRHRLDLAQRSGEQTIPAQIHEEATGFNAQQAAMLDAELNIRDQQGKVKDYVAYFENAGIPEADADARGLLARAPGKQGFAIASKGSPELVAAHRADVIPDAGAAAIANAAPGDSRLQAVGIKAIQEGKSPLAAVNTIKAVQAISKDRPPTEGGDLFGFDDSAMREAEEMAKIATLKQNQIAQRLAAISGASRRPEIAKKEGIDIKDPEALKKREKELRQQKASWDNWPSSPELVEEIRKEMAPKPEEKPSVREAEPKELPKDVEAKIDALGKALQRILTRYGLKDVGLRLVADMKAEGEYASKVLSLALDAADPVVALRHEAIHAMKELGFFSPAQWKSLERQAKEKWVDQYLKQKNVNRQPLQPGQISRYDAYMKFYGGDQEAILEEAIADAFADFSATKAPPGMLQALLKKIQNFFQGIKEAFGAEPDAERIFKKAERGELRAGPIEPDSWKDTAQEEKDAEKYEEQNGILPYTSAGQIEVPVEAPKLSIKAPYGEKELAKGKENHPVLNVPLNANGTVTLYFPTSNLSAREVAKTKRLKAASPTANRIYLTNESNPAAVRARAGNIDQGPIEANVMVQVPPEMLQFDMEHSDGRRDFFIQLAEGNAFAEKMKMTKLFTLYKPRSEAIAKTTTIGDIGKGLETAISAYKQLSPADQRAKLAQARQVLKDEHNVGTLLGENGKLQKTRLNEYQLPEDIQNSVASLGLGLASAQKINERNLSTCPQSARCEGLCLGETSGQNQLYGGDGPFRAGPRLSQYLKTEALVMHPEEFGIVLYDEIKKFESWAKSDKGFEVITDENGEKSRVKKQVYTPAIRLNVTSDFPPKMLKPFIEGFPGVRFYDYTKLATPGPIADNHHLTYSSDGAAQVVEGKTVGVGSNWDAMIKRLNNGFNVAMAFTSKRDMPDFVLDEKTGDKFQVWNGDNYDARFLDPRPGQKGNLFNKGMIIGLTNKDRTGRPEDAALRHDGFFVDYDRERDGDTVVIRDQEKIKAGKKIIPIAKPSLRETDATWSDNRIDKLINEYGYIDGRTFGIAAYVKPEDFIRATTPSKDFADEIKAEAGKLDRERIARQSQTPFLEWDIEKGVIIGHEGRHRMAAMVAEGVESAPIVLYVKDRFGAKKPDQYERRDSVEIKGQRFESGRGLSLTATNLIPLEYRQTKALKEEFGGESKVRFSLRDKLGLYSELEAKVSQGPGKGTAEAWKGYINGLTQKGVKPEEIEWSGVRDWLDLQKGSVTKEDLLAYLKNGGVQVEETVLRDSGDDIPFLDSAAKYSKYTLPGGENYREVLLTLPALSDPVRDKRIEEIQKRLVELGPSIRGPVGLTPERAEYSRLFEEKQDLSRKKMGYTSTHWDQPNVLAHIRVNDRTDADGNKVLFVEEIQSDWGQEGKKKGFALTAAQRKALEPGSPEAIAALGRGALGDMRVDVQEQGFAPFQQTLRGPAFEGLPVAPFVTKTEGWLNLALKRIMVMAGEGGYDKVAFVNGDQSAERYDLSKQIDRIDYNKNGNGTFNMSAIRNGAEVFSKEELSESQLADTVGKELAAKMVRGEGKDVAELDEVDRFEPIEDIYTDKDFDYEATKVKSLAGLDLKVGGEGMKTFYDTIVPTAVKKLLPKVGGGQMAAVKMGEGARNLEVMPHPDDPDGYAIQDIDDGQWYDPSAEQFRNEAPGRMYRSEARARAQIDYIVKSAAPVLNQPGFDVTPAMKERVRTTGLPRFSLRDTTDPVTRARVDQVTTPREEKSFIKRITEAIAPKSASSFRAAFLDRYNRLSEYDKELVRQMGGAPLLADASSHSAALMSDLSAGVLAGAMGVHDGVGGIPVYVNGHTKIVNNNNTVKGPIAIFAPLAKYNDPFIYQKYQFWAAVNRGLRLYAQGRDPKMVTPADQAEAAKILVDHPEFADIQKEWIKFNDGLVQYLKDTGVLTEAAAKEFVKYADYIPFYRQADGEETVGPQIFASLSGVRAPKKLKGSEAPLGEFLETVVRNVQYSIEAGMKNVAAQRAVNTAVAIGQANKLNYVSSAPNVIKVLENGKTSYYETQDLLFVEAMKSLNLGDLPFIGLLAGPANLLRNLVTKDPAFMLANMMRDSMSAWVSSGVKMTPFVDTLTNFTKALRNQNPEYSALLNSGVIGGYDYSQGVEISARRFDRALRKEAGVYTPAEKLARPFTSLWDALEKGTTASDAATRMEVYKKTLAETGNEAEALFRAVEVMNFNRKGNNPLVRVLTAAVPFLNARMQGLDVLYRAAFGRGTEANAKDIQKSFFIRGMTIAALSTMYWMLASEDDEWKRQEQETRDNYWILGDVKIPIPFEIGVLFKVIPERILEYSFGDDTGKDFLKSMTRQLTSTLSFNPIPQTALPLIESVTNYSFFTGRPIVSQGLEDVNPAYQIAPGTSRIGELIGGATKDLPTALQLSPVKIDEMIRGYTGTIGGYMMDLFDAIYDMNTDAPKAAKRFEQMPVIRRFAVDPLARGQVTAYYELKNSVDEAVRTANLLERNMKPQEWGEFMQENMGLLATKDYVLDLEKSMKQYREMKNFVRASTMSAGEKKDIIANITELENNLASNIQEIKKMIAEQ